jgi:hypothetical protein
MVTKTRRPLTKKQKSALLDRAWEQLHAAGRSDLAAAVHAARMLFAYGAPERLDDLVEEARLPANAGRQFIHPALAELRRDRIALQERIGRDMASEV